MNTAKFIRQIDGWTGDARLYRLTPPLENHEYVIVSAVDVQFPPDMEVIMQVMDSVFGPHLPRPLASGLETLIFSSDESGKTGTVISGIRGELNHSKALEHAGYVGCTI